MLGGIEVLGLLVQQEDVAMRGARGRRRGADIVGDEAGGELGGAAVDRFFGLEAGLHP